MDEDFAGTTFDRASGEVLSHFVRPAAAMLEMIQIHAELCPEIGIHPGHLPLDKLVDPHTGAVIDKPAWSPRAGVNTVTGLPDGTRAMVEGRWAEVVDGTVTIEVDWPQTVRVELHHPQHGSCELAVPCEPVAGQARHPGAHRIEQDVSLLRAGAYPSVEDQVGDLIKALAGIPELAARPGIAALIAGNAAVKSRFPKKG